MDECKKISERKGCRPKKPCIFTDIVEIGGREVNTISKKSNRNDFLTNGGEGEVTKHIVKNRNTLFCMICYSIWPNQGTLCLIFNLNLDNEANSQATVRPILGKSMRNPWQICGKSVDLL